MAKKLKDFERVLIFLYVLEKGVTEKFGESAVGQINVLSLITGWPEDRVKDALERAMANGYASFELNDDAGGEG